MVGYRAVLVVGVWSAVIAPGNGGWAVAAEQHGKSAKQCNDELKANAAAIEAAHESASAFFHACWWDTAAGKKTPIEAASKPIAAPDEDRIEAGRKTARQRHPDEREALARPVRRAARWEDRRLVSRPPPREDAVSSEPVDVGPVAVDAGTGASLRIGPPSAPAPLVERLPVTVAGVPNAVVLPVLPGYAPLVRGLLNNPVVPGLTAAP